MPDNRSKSERERVGAVLAERRRAERDIKRRRPANPARRAACLADPLVFLPTYFPDKFSNPWTSCQVEMALAIWQRARLGGDKAISGPRGCGKTTIVEGMVIYCIFSGLLKFALILAATGPDGSRILDNIKFAIETSDLLCEDFPEVCDPIRGLEGSPQRGNMQTYEGERTNIEWSRDRIVFPRTAGSPCSGCIVMARGIDGSIRGMNVFGTRPDFVLLDDIDTRESADSEHLTEKRERAIERDVAGLAGPGKKIAKVMLCTPLNRTCNAYRYTDRADKHSWDGTRYKLLEEWPARREDWELQYIPARQAAQKSGDSEAVEATQLYVKNRLKWDEGAKLSDESRFVTGELSALQHCFNIICDRGLDAFLTEYQSDPPEEAGPVESGITAGRIQKQVNGFPRGLVPPGCVKLTRGIDCKKTVLHWVVRAWLPDATGYTIDYGVFEHYGDTATERAMDATLEKSILAFLEESRDKYFLDDGEARSVDRTLIDAGWRTHAVYAACLKAGLGVMPVMGFGKSAGCTSANFHESQEATRNKRPGEGFFLSRKKGLWLVCADADRWKAWEHDRWMTEPGLPGRMTLFGAASDQKNQLSPEQRDHHSYAHHIVNEVEIEEPYRGGMRRRWKEKGANHWLDASYYADVAGGIEGIRLGGALPPRRLAPSQRPSARDLAGQR